MGGCTWDQKIHLVGQIFDDFGLSNASALTKTHMCAILTLAGSSEETLTVTGLEFYNNRKEMAKFLEKKFKLRSPHHGKVTRGDMLI